MKIVKRLNNADYDRMMQGKIRIGSLSYYKFIEDDRRKDSAEGPRPIHVEGNTDGSRVIDAEEFNRISDAVGSVIKIQDDKLKIRLKGEGKLAFDSDINVFMFCSTVEQRDGNGLELDNKFGSKIIEIFDPIAFSKLVANKLYDEVFVKKNIGLSGKADTISFGHAKVLYMEKKSTNADTIEEFPKALITNIDDVFIKPTGQGYEEEHEYRFVWFPFCNPSETMCSPEIGFKYVDLEIHELDSVIRDAT